MFLRNIWYVAGFSRDLPAGQRVARRFLGESVVLFRTETGELGALEDRCCHRAMPLSDGFVDGSIIRCCYHGVEFDKSGACTRIPGQDRIPAAAFVRPYPIFEKDAVMFIWMGDPAQADPELAPSHRWHSDAQWAWSGKHYGLKANWRLLVDNLMDLTHLAYVHARTIGGNPEMHFKTRTQVKRDGNNVTAYRHMPNSIPPRTYVDAAGFKGNIDRWQEIEFEPMVIRVLTGGCEIGTGAYEGKRDHAFQMVFMHAMTPETEDTTHYMWTAATNRLDRGIPEIVFEQIDATIDEDTAVLESQQRRMSETPGGKLVDIAGDNASNQVRHVIAGMFEAERSAAAAAE